MPFLMKKTGAMRVSALMPNAVRVGNGVAWQEDDYTPSSQLPGFAGYGLPAPSRKSSERRMCGSAECESGWTMPWRNKRRPIFEGQWGCSGRCVLAMVQSAVRRESGDGGVVAGLSPHRHRVPLGLLMLAQGWITQLQLQKALSAQRVSGSGKIGEWLMNECGVEPDYVTRGLSMQWGCPVLTTEGFSPEAMALVVPRVFVERFGLLPLRVAGSRILYVGFADGLDAASAFALEQMTELKVESGVVEGAQFEAARSRLLACDGVETKLETVENMDSIAARITAILEQKQPVAARLVRVHQDYWLRMWLESGTVGKTGSLPVSHEDVRDHIFAIRGQ
ncbi:hypothetical protein [Granulicella sp. S190]|uniref:GspE/PulE/PilB domain-containing protein n=1 Tax=Granulicella sp. S190 TaxID=1747226 RepID=UPI00131B9721|nr:hypothetical protein [Granulicella sp. S190]